MPAPSEIRHSRSDWSPEDVGACCPEGEIAKHHTSALPGPHIHTSVGSTSVARSPYDWPTQFFRWDKALNGPPSEFLRRTDVLGYPMQTGMPQTQ